LFPSTTDHESPGGYKYNRNTPLKPIESATESVPPAPGRQSRNLAPREFGLTVLRRRRATKKPNPERLGPASKLGPWTVLLRPDYLSSCGP
jgi:hypothetical protein